MKTPRMFALLSLVLAACAACATTSVSPTASIPSPSMEGAVSEVWQGDWSYQIYKGTITLYLATNSKGEVEGKFDFVSPDVRSLYNEPVRGRKDGAELNLKISRVAFGTITATVDSAGKEMTGTYIGFYGAPVSFTARKK